MEYKLENTLINISLVLLSFFLMEFVAWFVHKYVMHGFLWILHQDHHTYENNSIIHRNDAFFFIFAIPGIFFIMRGISSDFNYLFWIGVGVSLYGLVYFLIHEVYIHQRFKLFKKINHPYFTAIRRAHKDHHKHINKYPGENFGLLIVPLRYYKEAKKNIYS